MILLLPLETGGIGKKNTAPMAQGNHQSNADVHQYRGRDESPLRKNERPLIRHAARHFTENKHHHPIVQPGPVPGRNDPIGIATRLSEP